MTYSQQDKINQSLTSIVIIPSNIYHIFIAHTRAVLNKQVDKQASVDRAVDRAELLPSSLHY
jgi:hypothetical protein